MYNTRVTKHIRLLLNELFTQDHRVKKIVTALDKAGARTYLVGGSVRDMILEVPIKDFDIEVHGLSLEQLESILGIFGGVDRVGKSFGVLRLKGVDIDWSIPRTDTSGRKPSVTTDPHLDIKKAFLRRDLTMNALGVDVITCELVDPFGGINDIKKRILRTPDVTFFVQDPLRFFRVMQFIGRFKMMPDAALTSVCQGMDLQDVSLERKEEEFAKLLLKSERPSRGFRWLRSINRLYEILPELAQTIGVEQSKQWHPEGDVFEHTMQALDAAARFTYDDSDQKLIVLYAALCHDLGKISTTKKDEGKITSFGHAQEGVVYASSLLKRMIRKKRIISAVIKLIRYHLVPIQLVKSDVSSSAYKRLANKLAPEATLFLLACLFRADKLGRNSEKNTPLTIEVPEADAFERRAEQEQVLFSLEAPVLQGRDLIDTVAPGPCMGLLLKKAYAIQLNEGIRNKALLKRRVLESKE